MFKRTYAPTKTQKALKANSIVYSKVIEFLYSDAIVFEPGIEPIPGEVYINTRVVYQPLFRYLGKAGIVQETIPKEAETLSGSVENEVIWEAQNLKQYYEEYKKSTKSVGSFAEFFAQILNSKTAAIASKDAAIVSKTNSNLVTPSITAATTTIQGAVPNITASGNSITSLQPSIEILKDSIAASLVSLRSGGSKADIASTLTTTIQTLSGAAVSSSVSAVSAYNNYPVYQGDENQTYSVKTATELTETPRLEQILRPDRLHRTEYGATSQQLLQALSDPLKNLHTQFVDSDMFTVSTYATDMIQMSNLPTDFTYYKDAVWEEVPNCTQILLNKVHETHTVLENIAVNDIHNSPVKYIYFANSDSAKGFQICGKNLRLEQEGEDINFPGFTCIYISGARTQTKYIYVVPLDPSDTITVKCLHTDTLYRTRNSTGP